jgi:GDP/UDP-N,N'-diacetylbacillosamine 2-epimerase (hydrolysing)
MRIGILTSSRADYGIYKPLLKLLANQNKIKFEIIAFGMHLEKKFGFTLREIIDDGFSKIRRVKHMPHNDTEFDISNSYGTIVKKFSFFWRTNSFDYIVAIGDRFEMSAAVQASIPFQCKIIHIHGGETTLGAIDNIYRHQITSASYLHFVSTNQYKKRVAQIIGSNNNIYNVGSLSLDGIKSIKLPNWINVCNFFNIPSKPYILVTIHPETTGVELNLKYSKCIYNVLKALKTKYHIIITGTNADNMGNYYIKMYNKLYKLYPNQVSLVESFGKYNYFSAIKNCNFLLGNSSSGIIEAASFNKYVINIGNRQSGRISGENVINVRFNTKEILKACYSIVKKNDFKIINQYYKANPAINIYKNILKTYENQ